MSQIESHHPVKKKPAFSKTLGKWVFEGTRWTVFWVVLSFLGLLTAIALEVLVEPKGWGSVAVRVGIVVLPLLISLLVAPKQKPEDHSKLATQAISELLELRRSHDSMVDVLSVLDDSQLDPEDVRKIPVIIHQLDEGRKQFGNHVGYWGEVSPNVLEELSNRRAKQNEILAEMEKDSERYRNEDEV